jgi:hypothetical protein
MEVLTKYEFSHQQDLLCNLGASIRFVGEQIWNLRENLPGEELKRDDMLARLQATCNCLSYVTGIASDQIERWKWIVEEQGSLVRMPRPPVG